jgi:hypothetical protein
MTIPDLLYIVGLVLGIVSVVEARGRSWAGWGVIAIAAGLLYGSFV